MASKAPSRRRLGSVALPLVLAALASPPAGATGQARQVTATDYAHAEAFLGYNTRNLVSGDQVSPRWIDGGDRFWYRNHVRDGKEFILVDPAAGTRRPVFDHDRLAAALSMARDTSYEGRKLPFDDFELTDGSRGIRFFLADSVRWSCDIVAYACTGPDSVAKPSPAEVKSPDGQWVAFSRDENLWVRNLESGQETQLSKDGEKDWGYAVPTEGCCSAVTVRRRKIDQPPVLAWSPDSKRIATHRFDERNVREMALIETNVKGPVLWTYHNALPGDSVIPKWDVWVFDVPGGSGVRADRPPQDNVNTSCCWLTTNDPEGHSVWKDARWGSGNSDEFFYTYGQRSFDTLKLVAMDAHTGATRTVITETSPTFVEENLRSGGIPNWRVINGNREAIWFSERDGWGHLYLYDAQTGALKNQITRGPWLVVDLLHVDEANRWVYFTAVGREAGENPYWRHLYRARLDGSSVELLTPEPADHEVEMSPSGRWIVDTYSTRVTEPVTVLRSPDGRTVRTLEKADFSALLATGWQWPIPFTTKGRDGVTDVYGYLYLPRNLEEGTRYPVIDYIYPGPQTGPIGFRQATTGPRGNGPALTELGFAVFTVDAMGTPLRSKAFHDAYYGDMVDNGIPDHIAAIKALAMKYPLDVDRVGIYGHSGGGFSSTDAILHHGDFYKVAVSSSGNHDNRSYDYTWGEKYQGLLKHNADGTDNFDSQANQNAAKDLKGKLLLMYGTLDDNVHPNATLLVIDELIKNNLDFDLIVMPNRNHGYAGEPYVVRRTWDYFVKNLMGAEPPHQYRLTPPAS